jgi:thymidylate synthase
MHNYLQLIRKIGRYGDPRKDRTGVGTQALFTEVLEYDLAEGFPLVTTKRVPFNAIKAELLWFLKGSSDVNELKKLGCNIWNANAEAPYWKPKAKFTGDLGRIYGVQWRSWRGVKMVTSNWDGSDQQQFFEVDQFQHLITSLRDNRADRRMIVSAWNPGELDQMALPPCHMMFQCFVRDTSSSKPSLDLTMYQRSCDTFLGVPFNIASYALLNHMLAQVCGLKPGILKLILGDVHIYDNHWSQVGEQLLRFPRSLPKLVLNPEIKDINAFTMRDITLEDYNPWPAIKAEMAV